MSGRARRRRIAPLLAALVALLGLAAANATPASASSGRWQVITRSAPTLLQPGKPATINILLVNLGDAPVIGTTEQPITITDHLPVAEVPAGLEASQSLAGKSDPGSKPSQQPLSCQPLPTLSCSFVGEVAAFSSIELTLFVHVESEFTGGENEVEVASANAATEPAFQKLLASAAATTFGLERYELSPEEESGALATEAGSHPFQLTTTLEFNQQESTTESAATTPGLVKNLNTVLPPGLIGNPFALPTCSTEDFSTVRTGDTNLCPEETAIGVADVTWYEPGFTKRKTNSVPIFNLKPAVGEPARLGFEFGGVPVTIDTAVKTGDGYAVEAKVSYASSAVDVLGTSVTIWGVPGESSHNGQRGWQCLGGGFWDNNLVPKPACEPSQVQHPLAYLTLPTTCEKPLESYVLAESWEKRSPRVGPIASTVKPSLTGCESLEGFEPTISVAPDEKSASTPSGLNVEVSVPLGGTLSGEGTAAPDVRATTLTLPQGLEANAGAAVGLDTCSIGAIGLVGRFGEETEESALGGFLPRSGGEGGEQEQLEKDTGEELAKDVGDQYFTGEVASCPDASKIGEVKIRTPLLEHELTGSVYFGGQDTNPFASPLVLYIVAEDKTSGVRVKLAGETQISETGQLTSVFRETPPVPFETLKLHLFNGPRATLSTPALCRSYVSNASFVPWSGQESWPSSSSFEPESGPNGTPCQSEGPLPFAPSVVAGSTNPQAGAFTSFSLTVGRPDGQQPLKQIDVQLPEGLAGVLATVPLCTGEQATKGECPKESIVGKSTAYAGLGPDTVSLPGTVYLTGPIKGAPFGLLDETEAKAGPFNLGKVDVLSTITVNETTAAVTVKSDPLPQYVKGVPSQIKALNVTVERPDFQFNPTNCTPTSVGGTLSGYEGATSTISSPFDVVGCASLPFKPKLTATVGAKASKLNGASFNVKIESAGIGQANIHKVMLELPESLPSRNSTLQKACLEKVFDENPAGCDEGSVIGSATVHTPVLKNPLSGPAYLVSHGGAAFPDVEFVLQGEGIKLILDGKTDIKKINGAEVTFSKFESSPDAPFTTFETNFPTGPHSVLTSYVPKDEYNLCAATNLTMPTTIVAQNGATIQQTTKIVPTGCAAGLSKAQKLAAALKSCKKDKKKKKRAACQTAARKKYGAAAKKASLKRHAKKASKNKH